MTVPFSINNFSGGIQNYPKTPTVQNGYYFGQCINYRDDPQAVTLNVAPVKESGSVVIDLLKWGDLLPSTLESFFYGNVGNIYQRTSTPTWSNIHTAANSHGNGLSYFFADDFLYYTCDYAIGRYGPVTTSSSPTFSDDFITAYGGTPQNTASLVLVAASDQYAHAADSASLDITSDITLEGYFKCNTLPAVGHSMTLIGKWDESGATRSYKMDLYGVSGYFGDGHEGALTINSNTIENPYDSSCTGTAGTNQLTATNVNFAAGQIILIHQSQGTNAGQWERNTIQSYTAGTITTGTNLIGTYTTGAQVRVLHQYTDVTITANYSPKAWNGTTGGILAFLASGTVTVNGAIIGDYLGYRGGITRGFLSGATGEGYTGPSNGGTNDNFDSYNPPVFPGALPNGNGGGGGSTNANGIYNGAGGGSNSTQGAYGSIVVGAGQSSDSPGYPGLLSTGTNDLTTMTFGGGGGSGDYISGGTSDPIGGSGGAIIFITGVTITGTGSITSKGQNAVSNAGGSGHTGSAAGAGGSILLQAQIGNLAGLTLSTIGGIGIGGTGGAAGAYGGNGGLGYIVLDYLTSYTDSGNDIPTLNPIQDSSLYSTTSIVGRLSLSSDGTTSEYYSQVIPNLSTGVWNRLSIAWTAVTSTAQFYINGNLIGSASGADVAIKNTTALLTIGANNGGSGLTNYFDGKFNDFRIWSAALTAGQIFSNNQIQVPVNSSNLSAYYTFNSTYHDATANANNLTAVNAPTFDTTDVPFPAAATRLDIDQSYTTGGQIYTLPNSIIEDAADMLSFTPNNDPQKSVAFDVDTKGTGDWTVTVHDQQNKLIATQTILNAQVPASGFMEFIFSTPWRIVIGKTYHMHLTVSVGTSKVVTSSAGDFALADFYTYFGILVTDTQFHPIMPFLNYVAIGNERYVAKWDGAFYYPNLIAFPAGWRVRCFGTWREYLAIGVWRGTEIDSYTHGRVYFWDGISPTFNFFIDVPDGQVNALWGRDSDLFIIAGYRGDILDYQGNYFFDTGNSSSIKLRWLPKRSVNGEIEVYPGALNYWRNLIQIGYGINNSMSTVNQGVYSYGTYDPQLSSTISYDYIISTGNTGNTVSIGLVYPIGSQLIIGWQDGIAYGADVVDWDNNPYATHGTIETLIQDDDVMWRQKNALQMAVECLPLPSGSSIDVGVKIDRASSYMMSPVNATVGSMFQNSPISNGLGKEYQLITDLYSDGSSTPTLTGISLLRDDNKESQQFG